MSPQLALITLAYSQNSASNVSNGQVAVACGAFFALAAVTIFAFQILRPNNKIVYAPKFKYAEGSKQPPKVGNGFFDWVGPVWSFKEQDLLPMIGLDAVAYLRFGRMMRWMISCLAVAMAVVLMPVDAIYNSKYRGQGANTSGNNLFFITMKDVSGSYLWAHVAMSYVGTIIALTFSEF